MHTPRIANPAAYCTRSASRFAVVIGIVALAVGAWVFNAARMTQIQTLDSELSLASNGILAQFHALSLFAQAGADKINAAPMEAMRQDDDPPSSGPRKETEGDGSPVSFVAQIGTTDDAKTPEDQTLYVRLVDRTGAIVSESPSLKARPDIEQALSPLHPERHAGTTVEFAGGGRLPVMRVETDQLHEYRLQVARSWKKSGDWLVWFASALLAAAAALAALAGAGGFAVARGDVLAGQRLEALAASKAAPLRAAPVATDEPVVAERKLAEAPQQTEKPLVSEETVIRRRLIADDDVRVVHEEQQRLGRGPDGE